MPSTPLGDIHPSTQLSQVVSSHILSSQACPRSLSYANFLCPPPHTHPPAPIAWFPVTLPANGEPQRAKDHPRLQCGKDTPRAKPRPRDFTPPHPPASSPAWWPLTRKGLVALYLPAPLLPPRARRAASVASDPISSLVSAGHRCCLEPYCSQG